MKVAIAGGHGKIALHLERLLSQRGDRVLALIRNPEHEDDVRAAGAEPVVCDLEGADEEAVKQAIDDANAVVFAAGAGPGSGPERKETMDYEGAVKLVEAAKETGARYVMVSSMGADPDADGDDTFSVYQRAKGRADKELMESGVPYVIVRPGGLTDNPGTGRVELAPHVERGEVSREDVAVVLAGLLADPSRDGEVLELVGKP